MARVFWDDEQNQFAGWADTGFIGGSPTSRCRAGTLGFADETRSAPTYHRLHRRKPNVAVPCGNVGLRGSNPLSANLPPASSAEAQRRGAVRERWASRMRPAQRQPATGFIGGSPTSPIAQPCWASPDG